MANTINIAEFKGVAAALNKKVLQPIVPVP